MVEPSADWRLSRRGGGARVNYCEEDSHDEGEGEESSDPERWAGNPFAAMRLKKKAGGAPGDGAAGQKRKRTNTANDAGAMSRFMSSSASAGDPFERQRVEEERRLAQHGSSQHDKPMAGAASHGRRRLQRVGKRGRGGNCSSTSSSDGEHEEQEATDKSGSDKGSDGEESGSSDGMVRSRKRRSARSGERSRPARRAAAASGYGDDSDDSEDDSGTRAQRRRRGGGRRGGGRREVPARPRRICAKAANAGDSNAGDTGRSNRPCYAEEDSDDSDLMLSDEKEVAMSKDGQRKKLERKAVRQRPRGGAGRRRGRGSRDDDDDDDDDDVESESDSGSSGEEEAGSGSEEDSENADEEEEEDARPKVEHILLRRTLTVAEWRAMLRDGACAGVPPSTEYVRRGVRLYDEDEEDEDDEGSRDEAMEASRVERFLVKWSDLSYLHVSWETETALLAETGSGDPQTVARLKRGEHARMREAKQQRARERSEAIADVTEADSDAADAVAALEALKEAPGGAQQADLEAAQMTAATATAAVAAAKAALTKLDAERRNEHNAVLPFDARFLRVERIIACRCLHQDSAEGEEKGPQSEELLVKWCGMGYAQSTWEVDADLRAPTAALPSAAGADKGCCYERGAAEAVDNFNEKRRSPRAPSARQLVARQDRMHNAKRRGAFTRFSPDSPPPLPHGKGANLRAYQQEGISWLVWNWLNGRNSLLADEMGLGKTVQSSTFLHHLIVTEELDKPCLVVAPLSTLAHWQREIDSWTGLNVVVYHGTRDDREIIREQEFHYDGTPPDEWALTGAGSSSAARRRRAKRPYRLQVLVTSFEMLQTEDYTYLQAVHWGALVVDEAHRMKNRESRLFGALQDLNFDDALLLTGTPIQNSMSELYTLMNFVDEHRFPEEDEFLEQFGGAPAVDEQESVANANIEGAQILALHAALRSYMLLRVKAEVEKDLPPKFETVIEVELTTLQKKYYRAIFEKNAVWLRGQQSKSVGGTSSSSGAGANLMSVAMELRKMCNHPYLIPGVEEVHATEMAGAAAAAMAAELEAARTDGTPEAMEAFRARARSQQRCGSLVDSMEALVSASGKLELLDKLLPQLRREGHRVLIFSQFTTVLDILEEYLAARLGEGRFERIDGAVSGAARQVVIDRFCAPRSRLFAMLLTTRAGGVGINLTAADTCIIFDSDWNPQNDIQAMARCHRIGQTKEVRVFRLITKNTYEMEMYRRANLKLGLDHAVLKGIGGSSARQAGSSGGGADSATGAKPAMTREEIERLLRHGAIDLFREEAGGTEASECFAKANMADILRNNSTTRQIGGRGHVEAEAAVRAAAGGDAKEGAGSLFSKASFVSSGCNDGGVDIDDPDFWTKVVGQDAMAKSEKAAQQAAGVGLSPLKPRAKRPPKSYWGDGTGDKDGPNSAAALQRERQLLQKQKEQRRRQRQREDNGEDGGDTSFSEDDEEDGYDSDFGHSAVDSGSGSVRARRELLAQMRRGVWTKRRLRQLVAAVQARGIFDMSAALLEAGVLAKTNNQDAETGDLPASATGALVRPGGLGHTVTDDHIDLAGLESGPGIVAGGEHTDKYAATAEIVRQSASAVAGQIALWVRLAALGAAATTAASTDDAATDDDSDAGVAAADAALEEVAIAQSLWGMPAGEAGLSDAMIAHIRSLYEGLEGRRCLDESSARFCVVADMMQARGTPTGAGSGGTKIRPFAEAAQAASASPAAAAVAAKREKVQHPSADSNGSQVTGVMSSASATAGVGSVAIPPEVILEHIAEVRALMERGAKSAAATAAAAETVAAGAAGDGSPSLETPASTCADSGAAAAIAAVVAKAEARLRQLGSMRLIRDAVRASDSAGAKVLQPGTSAWLFPQTLRPATWWRAGVDDTSLLRGVLRHGWPVAQTKRWRAVQQDEDCRLGPVANGTKTAAAVEDATAGAADEDGGHATEQALTAVLPNWPGTRRLNKRLQLLATRLATEPPAPVARAIPVKVTKVAKVAKATKTAIAGAAKGGSKAQSISKAAASLTSKLRVTEAKDGNGSSTESEEVVTDVEVTDEGAEEHEDPMLTTLTNEQRKALAKTVCRLGLPSGNLRWRAAPNGGLVLLLRVNAVVALQAAPLNELQEDALALDWCMLRNSGGAVLQQCTLAVIKAECQALMRRMARVLHSESASGCDTSEDVLKPALAAKISGRVELLARVRGGLKSLSLPALTGRLRRLRSSDGATDDGDGVGGDKSGSSMPDWWCDIGGALDVALLRAVSRHGFVGWSVLVCDESLPFERAGRRATAKATEEAVQLPTKVLLEARVVMLSAALPMLTLSPKRRRAPQVVESPSAARSAGRSPAALQRSPRLATMQLEQQGADGSKRPSPVSERKAPSSAKKQKQNQEASGILSFFNRKQ